MPSPPSVVAVRTADYQVYMARVGASTVLHRGSGGSLLSVFASFLAFTAFSGDGECYLVWALVALCCTISLYLYVFMYCMNMMECDDERAPNEQEDTGWSGEN